MSVESIDKWPKNKNKNEEENKYKEKSKEYKNKYQGRAHMGQQWDSSDEDEEPKKQGMATVAMTRVIFTTPLQQLLRRWGSLSLLPHGKGEKGKRNYHLILSNLLFIHT
jgi:hypothetical protein